MTEDDIYLAVASADTISKHRETVPRRLSVNYKSRIWPWEYITLPMAHHLKLTNRATLELARLVIQTAQHDSANWPVVESSLNMLGQIITKGAKFRVSDSLVFQGRKTNRTVAVVQLSLRPSFSIPEALVYCRGLRAKVIYRILAHDVKSNFELLRDALLDILCAPRPPVEGMTLRTYACILRRLCRRHRRLIPFEELRRRIGAKRIRKQMLTALALGPWVELDEYFRQYVTIKLVAKSPNTRRMATTILASEVRRLEAAKS